MTRFELAQELQNALFAHPQAGPIPIPASLVTLIMEELRRPPSGEMVMVPRDEMETLRLIAYTAIKTRSRDVQDWIRDMDRVQAKADLWLSAPAESSKEAK